MSRIKGVTIGIPVYNEEVFIKSTVSSAVAQAEIVLISDNFSSDNTLSKCEEIASIYPHIEIIKKSSNVGALANFKCLLERATTPYFMWLGGHDELTGNYVREMKDSLDGDPDSILAFGSARHVDTTGKTEHVYTYDFADLLESKDPSTRILGIIKKLSDCSLIHGLFRTSSLKAAWVDAEYLACDHVLLAKAACLGKFTYLPNVEYIRRDLHEMDTPKKQLIRIAGKVLEVPQNKYESMQLALYTLVSHSTAYNGFDAVLFRIKARFLLIDRRGGFSQSKSEKVIDYCLYKLGTFVFRVKRKYCQFKAGKG